MASPTPCLSLPTAWSAVPLILSLVLLMTRSCVRGQNKRTSRTWVAIRLAKEAAVAAEPPNDHNSAAVFGGDALQGKESRI